MRAGSSLLRYSFNEKYLEITHQAFESRFHFVWLRDNCSKSLSSSHQKLHRSGDILGVRPLDVQALSDDKGIQISWSDNTTSEFPFEWLQKNAYDSKTRSIAQIQQDEADMRVLWTDASLKQRGGIPSLSYRDVMEDDQVLLKWLHHLIVYGVCHIKDVPYADSSNFEKVSQRLGPLRDTMYDRVFHVVAVDNPNNMAYTNLPLPYHQDLCYYEDMPGVQLLHCKINEVEGGENGFVDGFAVCQALKEQYPEAFDTLARVKQTFHKLDSENHRVKYMPMIGLDANGRVDHLRHSPPWEGPLIADFEEVEAYYDAYKKFTDIADCTDYAYKVKSQPGDLFSFDNQRVLHNRFPIRSRGKRHIQGCYVNREEIWSNFRLLSNRS